jgi:N-acetylmuramoyl-L-alanine amidase
MSDNTNPAETPEFTVDTLRALIDEAQPEPLRNLWRHFVDVSALGVTLDGEGRGESIAGRAAIAWTVVNRFKTNPERYGATIANVCLKRLQYSCWWEVGGQANYERTMRVAEAVFRRKSETLPAPTRDRLQESNYIAAGVIRGAILDPTHGATHYCTETLYQRFPPKWAVNLTPCARHGNHVFFKDVK